MRAIASRRLRDGTETTPFYTDSGWSLGVLIGGWKAKTNLELIEAIRGRLAKFPKLELLKVKGHAGQEGNEESRQPRDHGRPPRVVDDPNAAAP
jgi:ribonuclease HI